MSELNLPAIASTAAQEDVSEKTSTPIQEVNEALKSCKFGWFHMKLLTASLIGTMGGLCVTTATSYLLPIAECDLNMNLNQKGILSSIPFFGMLITSVMCGFLTDAFGRKLFLLLGYGGQFVFTVVSGSSQNYEMLVTSKFIEGVFFAMSFTPTITLTSEFLYTDIRDRVMLVQSSATCFTLIFIAGISWAILTQKWTLIFFDGAFVLNTWNFYLYIISILSLFSVIMYAFLPESPKYLVTQGRYEEAREVLLKVYKTNTRKTVESCPFVDLWKNKRSTKKISSFGEKVNSSLTNQVVVGMQKAKALFRRPLGLHLLNLCVMITCTMILYNIIRLWYPQLSTIVENFSGSNQDLCVVIDNYTRNEQNKTQGPREQCVPNISGAETYINSMILGLVSYLPYLVSGVLVNKVGKKFLISVSCISSAAVTLGIRFSSSKLAVLILFSADLAITQTAIALFQAILVETFPTSSRSLALSMMMTIGRLGTVLGTIGFPILLNMGCVIPFYSLVGIMLSVTILSIFLPRQNE